MDSASNSYHIPLLSGPTPGLLDASQRSRLLRTPTCSLFFAAFDPLTARADCFPNLSDFHIGTSSAPKRVNLEAGTGTKGKRVVIETDPESGTCSWRFVPRAKTEGELVSDEGPWPKVVELCGHLVRMTQDQWDIYKLDPEYDCLVRAPPNFTKISRIVSEANALPSDPTTVTDVPATPRATPVPPDDMTPTPKAKRSISPDFQDSPSPRKRKKTTASFSTDSDKMSIDEDIFYIPSTSAPKPAVEDVANGKKRRRVSERLGDTSTSEAGEMGEKPPARRPGVPPLARPGPRNRMGTHDVHESESASISTKKIRTHSPDAVRRAMEQKRVDREKKRNADMELRLRERRQCLYKAFWEDIGVPIVDETLPPGPDDSDADTCAHPSSDLGESDADEDDTEAERLAKIEESRRKLAELEKDKPLWEESARRRQERETQEEQKRRRENEMREENERMQERARGASRVRDALWEQELRKREHEARVKERSARMFIASARTPFRWGARAALERYVRTAADFDAAKFSSAAKPLMFISIPWPVLHASFSVQDVDWDAVEAFFGEIQILLTPAEFTQLVQASHKRFHPDRWRSRGLLVSVRDETERDLLEVAGSTVAQAITPLWKEVTGR